MSSKIDNELFSAHEHALETEHCPQCGGQLQMKYGKRGAFLGCDHYPECGFMRPLQQNDGHVVKALGVACPECGQELVLRQGRYGMFIGCSYYPECHHIESIEKHHQPESEVQLTCPECRKGHIVERNNRFGKVFYSCDNYPKCRFAINQQPVSGACETCGYPLLVKKKLASGEKYQCADKKCHQIQKEKVS